MKPNPTLHGAHLRTYNTIFQHPITHNLEWHGVLALLRQLGQVDEASNGHFNVTRNGHTLQLHRSHTKDVADSHEVMTLRHFLEQSETTTPASTDPEEHCVLVIDHHEARIFRSQTKGGQEQRILPYEPEPYYRHARDSAETSRGKEKPDPNTFFEPVARALQSAGRILIIGNGTGSSSEMEQFSKWVKIHNPILAARINGTLVVDEHHLTTDQLLGKAREFYAQAAAVTA